MLQQTPKVLWNIEVLSKTIAANPLVCLDPTSCQLHATNEHEESNAHIIKEEILEHIIPRTICGGLHIDSVDSWDTDWSMTSHLPGRTDGGCTGTKCEQQFP
jgi:hypothetical protein